MLLLYAASALYILHVYILLHAPLFSLSMLSALQFYPMLLPTTTAPCSLILLLQDSIHLLDVLLSQAVSLNLEYEIIGRSYYLPNKGTVLDIGFGKEVGPETPSQLPPYLLLRPLPQAPSPSSLNSLPPPIAGVDRSILFSPPPWLEGWWSAAHPQRGREQQARH